MDIKKPTLKEKLWAASLPVYTLTNSYKQRQRIGKSIFESAKKGLSWRIQYLIKESPEQNWLLDVLRKAATEGEIGVFYCLQQNNLDIMKHSSTTISDACNKGHIEIVKLLANNGADVDGGNGYPMLWAIRQNRSDIVDVLLNHGADPMLGPNNDCFDDHYITAHPDNLFFESTYYDNNINIIKLFIKHNIDIHIHDDKALFHAAARQNHKIFDLLIENGSSLENLEKWINIYENSKSMHPMAHMMDEGEAYYIKNCEEAAKSAREFIDNRNLLYKKKQQERVDEQDRIKSHIEQKERQFKKLFPSIVTLEKLREPIDQDGMTGLELAAQAGAFKEVVQWILQNNEQNQLSVKNLTKEKTAEKSIIDHLITTKTLSHAFEPKLWSNRIKEMKNLWLSIPKEDKSQVDFPSVLTQTNRLYIQRKSSRAPHNNR